MNFVRFVVYLSGLFTTKVTKDTKSDSRMLEAVKKFWNSFNPAPQRPARPYPTPTQRPPVD